MQEKRFRNFTIGFTAFATLIMGMASCDTKVDLNAPYMSVPVVFGLLDAELDTQWVKINRTWLGEGDQTQFALIADSSEYENHRLQAKFIEVINDMPTGREFPLKDTILENKEEDGAFFAPEYKAYYATTKQNEGTALDFVADYKLELVIDSTTEVEAVTDIIEAQVGNIIQPPVGIDIKMNFANVGLGNVTYPPYTFKWNSTEGAARYDAVLIVHYIEHFWADDFQTVLDSTKERTMEIPIGTVDPNNSNGGEVLSTVFNGFSFYSNMSSRLEASPRITRELGVWDDEGQIARAFDFVLMVANTELATYLDVSAPVTNIIQERPGYTNVNGGLGLWASRTTQGVYGLGYSTDTIEHLQEGDETADLNFCTPNPFSDYYCD